MSALCNAIVILPKVLIIQRDDGSTLQVRTIITHLSSHNDDNPYYFLVPLILGGPSRVCRCIQPLF